MTEVEGVIVNKKVIEGKTKIVYELDKEPSLCLVLSKDKITAGDGAKRHDMEGKAAISTETTCKIFEFLQSSGIKSHFLKRNTDVSFIAKKCDMIPIEWVSRRIATGSFLKRNQGVPEGYKFTPLKQEIFFKDDANHDPQWSFEQLISAKLKIGEKERVITETDVKMMSQSTIGIFEILERAWSTINCQLIDMKIEFGVDQDGAIILSDVIDSDSWRLWPNGDKRLMKDKQVYRDMQDVTQSGLEQVKLNFKWVLDQLKYFEPKTVGRLAVFMGSTVDLEFCKKIKEQSQKLGIPCDLRVCSGHKVPKEVLDILAYYEGLMSPVVLIAVAGRSNALGPLLSANTALPVINCPPLNADWASQDIWSSLHVPSGLSCVSVLSVDNAVLAAASIIGLTDHFVWSRLRGQRLQKYLDLLRSDYELNC